MQLQIDFAAIALDPVIHNLIIAQIVFIAVVVISASIAIYVDMKVWRRQRAEGVEVQKRWYTRPTFLFCLGVTLGMLAVFIDSATTTHFFPNTLFWNGLDIILLLAVLILIIAGFISVMFASRKRA